MKTFKTKRIRTESGFSIAWVGTFAMLIAATITISLTTEIALTNDRHQDTRMHMREIEKALSAYLLKMKRLPCPAPLNVAYTDDSYGKELFKSDSDGCQENDDFATNKSIKTNDDLVIGAIPSETLGVPRRYSVDGWGNKIVYVVDKSYTKKYVADKSTMSGWKDGIGARIIIKDNDINVELESIYALISYGSDGQGAFDGFATRQNSLPVGADELDNACLDGYVDDVFKLGANDIIMYHSSKNSNSMINKFDKPETL